MTAKVFHRFKQSPPFALNFSCRFYNAPTVAVKLLISNVYRERARPLAKRADLCIMLAVDSRSHCSDPQSR